MTDAPKHIFHPSTVIVSQGIRGLPQLTQAQIFSKIWSLNIYAPDKHHPIQGNSGIINTSGHEIYWKIEYSEIAASSVNPDSYNIQRILHIRLKSEGII